MTRKRRRLGQPVAERAGNPAPWPIDDLAESVCSFLFPFEISCLRALNRATCTRITTHELVWKQLMLRLSVLTRRFHCYGYVSLPLPPWLMLECSLLHPAFVLNPTNVDIPVLNFFARTKDHNRARDWIFEHVENDKTKFGVVVLTNVDFRGPTCDADQAPGTLAILGNRIVRPRTRSGAPKWKWGTLHWATNKTYWKRSKFQ